ncbi:MAG: histidinol-phosphate transaminase [Sporomusaceae bacterium]|nr:histidinol-phosphate transaminase [Sporomusaceae bacterium]
MIMKNERIKMMIKPRAVLDTFLSYTTQEEDLPVKLDANECAEDLPPEVKERVLAKLAELPFNRYPHISALDLRQQIAAEFGLGADNVLLGNGSSQLLQALCFTFADSERSVILHAPTFSMYNIYARLADSRAVSVETDAEFSLDRAKILAAAKKETAGLIILCNPNNPTGTVTAQADLEYIVKNAPCPVVIDEAYQEFYGVSSLNLLEKYPHLIIARTFSKAYALASARVGYILASAEVIAAVAKVIMPYNLNALSLSTAATVLEMKDRFSGRIAQIVNERQKLAAALATIDGIKIFPSQTNFLLIKMDSAAEGNQLAAYLAEQGISVRNFANAPHLTGCLRITIGTGAENNALLAAVKAFKERKL